MKYPIKLVQDPLPLISVSHHAHNLHHRYQVRDLPALGPQQVLPHHLDEHPCGPCTTRTDTSGCLMRGCRSRSIHIHMSKLWWEHCSLRTCHTQGRTLYLIGIILIELAAQLGHPIIDGWNLSLSPSQHIFEHIAAPSDHLKGGQLVEMKCWAVGCVRSRRIRRFTMMRRRLRPQRSLRQVGCGYDKRSASSSFLITYYVHLNI